MFEAVTKGAMSIYNLLPGAVKVTNDVLHAVYESAHTALHTLADVLTITMK